MSRPLLSDRVRGFGLRWIVRHATPCGQNSHGLSGPRYVGGWTPAQLCAGQPLSAPAPARDAFSRGDYRALRRRLDRWELQHLREHAADLAERLEAAERARADAEDAADHWREQAMNVELRDGECLGLAVDGSLHVIAGTLGEGVRNLSDTRAAGQKGGAA